MTNASSFTFNAKQWRSNERLRLAGAHARGIFVDILSHMHLAGRVFTVSYTADEFARVLGVDQGELVRGLESLRNADAAGVHFHGDGKISFTCYEWKKRDQAADIRRARAEGREVEAEDAFDRFWSLYPNRRGSRAAARAAWEKKVANPEETLELIRKALKWQTASEQWTKKGGKFIPYPTTYINQRRWTDQPESPPEPDADDMIAEEASEEASIALVKELDL